MIVAANDDMALGALQVVQEQGLDIAIIGFDALPEALASSATAGCSPPSSRCPAARAGRRWTRWSSSCASGAKPEPLVLLTPIAITKDNLDQAERLGEAS